MLSRKLSEFFFLALTIVSCSSGAQEDNDASVETEQKDPCIIGTNQGYVFEKEDMISGNQFVSVDIIAYKHKEGLDIFAGTSPATKERQPMKIYQGKNYKNISEVPSTKPSSDENNSYMTLAKPGDAAVVKNNVSPGYAKFLITETAGSEAFPQVKFTFLLMK
jgi:hypothetical protein